MTSDKKYNTQNNPYTSPPPLKIESPQQMWETETKQSTPTCTAIPTNITQSPQIELKTTCTTKLKQIVWKRCSLCKQLFDSQKLLNMSTNSQHNNCKYICAHRDCSFSSGAEPALKKHMLKHGTHKLLCTLCGKRLFLKSELNTHLTTHSDEKNYKCFFSQCTFSYKSATKLKWHEKHIHITPEVHP